MSQASLRRKILPHASKFIVRTLENLFITVGLLAVGFYFHRSDPLFFLGPFPWVILAPLVIALRYGFWQGLISNLLIIMGIFVIEPATILASVNAYIYMLGMVLTTFICGEFNDTSSYHLLRAQQLNSYARERLRNLTRSYYVVKLSHDRLEQSIATKPITLRKIFEELRTILAIDKGRVTGDSADRFINLLEQYCYITRAGFFKIEDNKIVAEPVAYVGEKFSIKDDDVLVTQALSNKAANYFSINQLEAQQFTDYLVVAPMRTSDGNNLALLVIKDMSFWSLNNEVLQILYALLSYFADEVWSTRIAHEFLLRYQDCPLGFASAFYKLRRLQIETGIDSVLMIFVINKSEEKHHLLLEAVEKEQRSLDFSWVHETDDRILLLVLKPFFSSELINYYVDKYEKKYAENNVVLFSRLITNENPINLTTQVLQEIHGN